MSSHPHSPRNKLTHYQPSNVAILCTDLSRSEEERGKFYAFPILCNPLECCQQKNQDSLSFSNNKKRLHSNVSKA